MTINSSHKSESGVLIRSTQVDRIAGEILFWVSLVCSAHLLTLAMTSPSYSWLAWVSLAPLFVAVRYFSPLRTAVAGAVWGISLYSLSGYLYSQGFVSSSIPTTISNFLMLVTVPALYLGLAALYTRRFGFSPLALATGWIAVELGLQSLGLHHALLFSNASYGSILQLVANILGYGFVAFLVAYTNAIILSLAAQICLQRGLFYLLCPTTDTASLYTTSPTVCFQTVYIQSTRPRAPPSFSFQ